MMYKMRRRKPELTLFPIDGIFDLPHHIGLVIWEELAFDNAVSNTQWGKWIAEQLNVMAMNGIRTPVTRATNPVP